MQSESIIFVSPPTYLEAAILRRGRRRKRKRDPREAARLAVLRRVAPLALKIGSEVQA